MLEEDDDRPLFTEDYIARWEDLDPHPVTDDESKILEKVKKNEKATLRLIIPILALLTVCFGYFLIVIPDRQLKFILMVIMLLFGLGWYAVFYMIHASNGNEHDNLVYGKIREV